MFENFEKRQRSQRSVVRWIVGGLTLAFVSYVVIERLARRSRAAESVAFVNSLADLAPPSGKAAQAAQPPQLGDAVGLTRVELPGMWMFLPGTEHAISGNYASGDVEAIGVTLEWKPGNFNDDAVATIKQHLFDADADPPTPVRVGDGPAFWGHTAEEPHLFTLFGACGHRRLKLRVDGTRRALERIAATFTCAPDRNLSHLGVVVAPHAGWTRIDDDPQIRLVDRTGATTIKLLWNQDALMMAKAISGDAAGEPEVRGDYRIWRGSGHEADGASRSVAVVDWGCKVPPYGGGAFIKGSGPLDDAIAVALTGSCIAPDAPLPAHLRPPAAR